MNKKKSSLFFLPLLVIVSLGVLVYLYIVLLDKSGTFSEPIGKRQFDLLNIYMRGEGALFYIDQSAKYALQQSIYELAKNGGISEFDLNDVFVKHKCGKSDDAYVLYTITKDKSGNYIKNPCFDENFLTANLGYFFNKNLNQLLVSSPYNILTDNYNYEFKNNFEATGMALLPLKFYILKDENKQIVKKPAEVQVDQQNLIDFTDAEPKLCAKGTKCLLTNDAYDLLLKAQNISKQKKLSLEVYSAYRDRQKQIDIWEGRTLEKYAQKYPDVKVRATKVCNPYSQGTDSCPHLTGKAVDVRFKGKTTEEMTNYDWVVLQEIMSQAGWVRYGDEKRFDVGERWHFECCGTDRYARAQASGVREII